MARYILPIVALFFMGFLVVSCHESDVRAEAKQAAAAAAHLKVEQQINRTASKLGAVTDWAENLAGDGGFRTGAILTAELQQHWILGRPILFIGKLVDVRRNDNGTYRVAVEYTSANERPMFTSTTLRVELDCAATQGEAALASIKARKDDFWTDVAVVGSIASVVSSPPAEGSDNAKTLSVGQGECLALMVLPEMMAY